MRIDITPRQIEAFWSKVRKAGPDGCWEWQASVTNRGYGRLTCGASGCQRNQLAHRIAYFLEYGDIPDDRPFILHTCDNRRCVNPYHLFAGTNHDNVLDAIGKQRFHFQLPTFQPRPGSLNGMAKLTEELVREIRARCAAGEPQRSIAADIGVSTSLVSQVKLRHIWKHV